MKIAEETLQNAFEALQKASQRQASILNALPANIALLDKEGRIIAVNEAWKKFNSLCEAHKNQVGDHYLVSLENDKNCKIGKQVAAGIRAVMGRSKKQFNLEYPYQEEKVTKWYRVEVTPMVENFNAGVVVMHLDITDRKKTEQKIIQSNERYRLVLHATSDAIWDWDLGTNEIYWSDGYEKLFGYGHAEEASIASWIKRIHSDDKERVLTSIQKEINNPESGYWESEYRYIKSDGSIAYVYDRGNIIFNEDNVPVRMLGAMQDITARKLAELERDRITTDLIQRNKDLEQFAYIISHNLRGPVSNIIGCTEILTDQKLDDDSKKSIIQGLSISVKKLDGVISDLNHILQIKHDIGEKKELINFSCLVDDIKVSIANLIEKEQVSIITNFEEVDEFLTLKTYMYSIFYNLISNSIKYRRADVSPVIEISTRLLKDKIEISFEDNGMGIDMKKKEQVFGLYKRFHNHKEGKGMGLFMVKTQVETLGGKINVQSEINKGTVFTILMEL
jgi:PAS domain S-box-containing protein